MFLEHDLHGLIFDVCMYQFQTKTFVQYLESFERIMQFTNNFLIASGYFYSH